MQCALKDSTVDFERMVDAARGAGYDGDIGLEYLWIDWEHLNECDTVSETILLRDRLEARIAGRSLALSGFGDLSNHSGRVASLRTTMGEDDG